MDYFFNEEEIECKAHEAEENSINEKETWILDFDFERKELMQDPYFRTLNMIYMHFSAADLLNLSLVCKEWHCLLGKLDTFSSRIKLSYSSINKEQMSDEFINAIKNSTRIYETLELFVWNGEKDRSTAENIVSKYSIFLKHLKLIKYGGHNNILNIPLDMPNLQELEIQVICGRLSGKFLKNVQNLKTLTVNGIESRGLKQILRNNASLTELTLYENSFIGYFKNDISQELTFKLNKLKVLDHAKQIYTLPGEFSACIWSANQRVNFLKFLSTQNSLTALHLDFCNADDVQEILAIPSLEMLELNKIIGSLTPSSAACSNIEIFLTKFEDMDASTLEILFTYMPNIQSLFIHHILKDEFLKIVENEQINKSLLNFYYFWSSEKEQGQLLNLKMLYTGHINVSRSTKDEFINLFGP